jgi:hypothetical protein
MVLKESLTKIEWGLAGIVLSSPLALRFAQYLEHQPTLCPLQRFAGMPCPSCGGTRAAFYLWGADPIQALKSNAGVTLLILALGGLVAAGKLDLLAFLGPDSKSERYEFP